MSTKKKTHKGPRWKRMKRKPRLDHVKSTGWLAKYEGENMVKGYSKRFAVDLLCAIVELRMLGVSISKEREVEIRKTLQAREASIKHKKRVAAENEFYETYPDFDDNFAYIASYTPGGAPYGVTWEEIDEKPIETVECCELMNFTNLNREQQKG